MDLLTKQRLFYQINQRRDITQKESPLLIYSTFPTSLLFLLLYFSKFPDSFYSAFLQVVSFLIMLSAQRLDFI